MKIGMIIAYEGFREEEYDIPKNLFEKEGYEVVVISSSLGEATGKFGTKVNVDLQIDNVNVELFNAIIFVGGPGTVQYLDDPVAHGIAKQTLFLGKVLGAICMAPVILARAGLLNKKNATVFADNAPELIDKGVIYIGKDVEEDDLIITGNGPNAAGKFGKTIINKLKSIN